MLDKISFDIKHQNNYNLERESADNITEFGLTFTPKYKYEKLIYWEHKSLLYDYTIRIYRGRFNFVCSLHKLYNRLLGNKGNHTDFKREQLIFVIEYLEELFNSDSSKMLLRNLEIGVNLKMNFESSHYYEMISGFQKNKPIHNMLNGNWIYGKQTYLTQYKVKVYDKKYEMKEHQNLITHSNLIRFEVAYKKMAPLKNICKTIADLKNKEVLPKLGRKLMKAFNQISFNDGQLDTSILKQFDRMLYFSGVNSTFWIDEKIANPNGCHNLKSKWNRVDKSLRDNTKNSLYNLRQEFVEKLEQKINELI